MIRYKKGIIPLYSKKGEYNDNIYTFDLENSNAWNVEGKAVGYSKEFKDTFFTYNEPISLMYIWQFSINNIVYYGRTYLELRNFLIELSQKHSGTKYIYVHNLSHEFVFLNNIIKFNSDNVFARKPHKIIFARVPELDIEFRCSYFLSGLSLENWGKKIGIAKKVGDLDYNVIRTPKTLLTMRELSYCEYDCLIVYHGIKKMLQKYEHIEKIPYTQTGEIRKEYKKRISQNYTLLKRLQTLIPSEEVYKILRKCFRGGDTHANYLKVLKTLYNVHSKDIASSYPTVMIAERFPMTAWKKWYKKEHDENHCYLMHIKLYNVSEKHCCHYIPKSKTEKCKNELIDNGRIVSADYIELWCTDIDFDIIQRNYNIGNIKIVEEYSSRLAYLPQELRNFILELFSNKTELKDVDGMEDLYLQSKQFINSLYGMCVTALINDDIIFTGNDYEIVNKSYDENMLPYFEKLYKNFLSYSWGVFVTAYARRNLWKAIEHIGEDICYYDTDSVKFLNGEKYNDFFNKYNNDIQKKLENSCKFLEHDYTAKDKNGNIFSLGVFESEGIYQEFRTLGAKRYVYRKNNNLYMTLAGVNKNAVSVLNNDINNFNNKLFFNREVSGKRIVTHSFNQSNSLWVDEQGNEYFSREKCGVNIRNASYNLNITEDFYDLVMRL